MMIPYGRQFVDDDDVRAVHDVLRSDWLTQGPAVSVFEKALASYCGARYAIAVSSGTAALHLAYRVAGLTKGDEIITTPNTFVATTNMSLVLGVRPVFCDIRSDTYNLDEACIEHLITKRTRAIVPVHFAGHPCEMNAIHRIAQKHKLLVIEDGCHALGASYRKRMIGSRADFSIFSFHPVKSITTGEGGAVTTNNKNFFDALCRLRSHGIHKDASGKNVMTELGFNYRLTDIQAALGRSQLKKLDGFIRKRHAVARTYGEALAGIPEIVLPRELPHVYSAWHLYVIRTTDPAMRDPLATHLKKSGIGINFHYPAVYSHPYYREHGWRRTFLPQADEYQRTCLALPCFPGLSRTAIRRIAQTIKTFFRGI